MEKQQARPQLKNLHQLIQFGATEFPQQPLFKFEREGVDYSISYSNFYDYVKAIARGMIHNGFAGKRIAVIGETSVEWIATYFAAIISGGVIVPLDVLLDKEQLPNFVNLAECDMLCYSNSWADFIESHTEDMPGVQSFSRLTDGVFAPLLEESCPFEKMNRLSDFVKIGNLKSDTVIPETDPEVMAALLFTSGTTGCSKGVMLSQKNICSVLNEAAKILNTMTTDDAALSVLPVHHTYELCCGIFTPMLFGVTICINDSIKHITRNLKKYRPTLMALVPLFLEQFEKKIRASIEKQGKTKNFEKGRKLSHFLMKMHIDRREKLFAQIREAFGGRLHAVVSGAAPLKPALVDFFNDLGIHISQGYGITECSPLISVVPFDVYNPTSCGLVTAGMQVFIDKQKPSDEFGEIVVKGDNVMLGYYKNPEATAEVMSKGWFYTGDYGYMDSNNYLYITGRKKNVIVLPGGKNVFPEEVEEYLSPVELIEECIVKGREKDGDVIITAIVYPSQTVAKELGLKTQEEIEQKIKDEIRAVNRRLVGYKQIRKVEFRAEPFEKTSTRKIKRFTVQ